MVKPKLKEFWRWNEIQIGLQEIWGYENKKYHFLSFVKKKRDLEVKESRPYQQCRLNMLLLLVWFELWTQYPGPLCLWQCLVLLRTYEPIFSQFGATLSNMCIRNAMASLKQTINQLIPALLTLLVVVPRQAFYPKSDLIHVFYSNHSLFYGWQN